MSLDHNLYSQCRNEMWSGRGRPQNGKKGPLEIIQSIPVHQSIPDHLVHTDQLNWRFMPPHKVLNGYLYTEILLCAWSCFTVGHFLYLGKDSQKNKLDQWFPKVSESLFSFHISANYMQIKHFLMRWKPAQGQQDHYSASSHAPNQLSVTDHQLLHQQQSWTRSYE